MTPLTRARDAVRTMVAALPAGLRPTVRFTLHAVKLPLRWGAAGVRRLWRPWPRVRARGFLIKAAMRASEFVLLEVAVPLGRYRGRVRLAQGAPASLWGTTPILTLPLKARADRLLGLKSSSLVFVTYYIARDFDYNLQSWVEWLRRRGHALLIPFERILLAWAICRYDIFHFFYDQGLTSRATRFGVNPRELELLQAAGKRVYLYAYGADVRRREETLALGRWNFCSDCPEPGRFCACTPDNAQIIAAMSASTTAANALGDMLAYVPNVRNMHYWPIDTARVGPAPAPDATGPLVIAHAPNHSHFKGSHYLEAAIETLRAEGHAIEYLRVQGVPNSEVIRLFGKAHLIADQFIGGAYGFTALEAMARGRPVLTYVRSPDLCEAAEECPLINVTPDTLEQALRWCLANRDRLDAIGRQGIAYVNRWHTIEAVAVRLGQMYAETAAFPEQTRRLIEDRRLELVRRLAAIPQTEGWSHPFLVTHGDPARTLGSSAK